MIYIPTHLIRIARHNLSADKIEKHRQRIQNGDTMPLDLRQLGDGTYVIAGNGRHRFVAYLSEGITSVPANIIH